jgi:hypothetical protein
MLINMTHKADDTESGNGTGQRAHSGGESTGSTGRSMVSGKATNQTVHSIRKDTISLLNEGVDKPKGLRRKEAYGLEGLQEDANSMRNFIRKNEEES